MWNDLSRTHSFSLFCSYRMGNFYKAGDGALFDKLCEAHTSVLPAGSTRFLEERVRSLENEIENRKQLEAALREALNQRAGVRVQADKAHRLVEEKSELGEERFQLLVESVPARPRGSSRLVERRRRTDQGLPSQ
jgi:hypothetical protein